jgi:hypothetical protein
VANQGQAFRVAGHAVNETVVIPQLVGMALDSITLSGMESILALAGPNAEVAEAVRKTITEQRPRFRMRDALEGEWALISRGMQRLGEGDPEAARQLGLPGDSAAEQAQKVTPADQRRVRREAADCIEAYTLSQVRTLIASCDQPYPARRPLLQRLLTLDKRPASNPMQRMGNMILPTLAQVATKEVAAHAQKEAVIAGAALLAYKARRGAFPDRLEQAFPQPPPDPFSGRPLKFRREGSGFVVYSIGPDGNFDGKPEAKRNPEHAYFRYPATPQPPPRG